MNLFAFLQPADGTRLGPKLTSLLYIKNFTQGKIYHEDIQMTLPCDGESVEV